MVLDHVEPPPHSRAANTQVVTEATPWEGGIVALSNFGFGGEQVLLVQV